MISSGPGRRLEAHSMPRTLRQARLTACESAASLFIPLKLGPKVLSLVPQSGVGRREAFGERRETSSREAS